MKSNRVTVAGFGRELLILVPLTFLLWVIFAQVIYPAIGWPSRAPIPARSAVLVVAIWFLMKRTGESWADFGFSRPKRIWLTVVLAFLFLVTKIVVLERVSDLVNTALELQKADHSFFDPLHGNPLALVGWLLVAWFIGGFAEEFIFRGYLMKRFAQMLNGGWLGWTAAVLGQALLFGLAHFYKGPAGMVSSSVGAVFFGIMFLLSRRNLWPVMIVHATWDTLGFVLIYLNGMPSTG